MEVTSEWTQRAQDLAGAIDRELAQVYMGDSSIVSTLTVALLARGHVLLEGVPGIAKTTLMKAFATALGLSTKRIQFTPDLMPSDITGTYVLSPKDGTFALRAGPVFSNIVLADEINRAPAKTQSALLEAMQEHQVTVEGDRYELPRPFLVVATQNPVDMAGTYPLPEAQIDRFMMRVSMGYPSVDEEVRMLDAHAGSPIRTNVVVDPTTIVALQDATDRVFVEKDLLHYAVAIARQTRGHESVDLGASPRATLSLVQAAKSKAILSGRAFVTPDDLRAVANPVLAHRLILSADAEGDRDIRARIVDEVIARTSYRRQPAT